MARLNKEAESKNGLLKYYMATFIIFVTLSFYSLSYTNQFVHVTCLRNDVSASSTKAAFNKFLKEMKAAGGSADALKCPPASYDESAFKVAAEAEANATAAKNNKSNTATDASSAGTTSDGSRLLKQIDTDGGRMAEPASLFL